jgi:hypothetical protein
MHPFTEQLPRWLPHLSGLQALFIFLTAMLMNVVAEREPALHWLNYLAMPILVVLWYYPVGRRKKTAEPSIRQEAK